MKCYYSSFAITAAAIATRHNQTPELHLLNPALTILSGTSLVFHALYKHDPHMKDPLHKALYIIDKTLTHIIALSVIPPAIKYSLSQPIHLIPFWMCYFYVFWIYYIQKNYHLHASIHIIGSFGLILLHQASLQFASLYQYASLQDILS